MKRCRCPNCRGRRPVADPFRLLHWRVARTTSGSDHGQPRSPRSLRRGRPSRRTRSSPSSGSFSLSSKPHSSGGTRTCRQSATASNRLPERTRTAVLADRGSEESNQSDPSQIQHRDAANGSCPAATPAETGAISDDQANEGRWHEGKSNRKPTWPMSTTHRQMDPARRAVGKKPNAAAPGNARIVPRLFTSALGGGLSAWAHATRGDSEARLRRLLLGTHKMPSAVAPAKSRDPKGSLRVPRRAAT